MNKCFMDKENEGKRGLGRLYYYFFFLFVFRKAVVSCFGVCAYFSFLGLVSRLSRFLPLFAFIFAVCFRI